jgi:hypothetical protein
MSSFVYGAVTRKRVQAESGASTGAQAPGVKTYLDTLAALVPAEVLAFHAFMVEESTDTKKVGGKAITTITDAGALKATFFVCIGLSIALFLFGRLGSSDPNKGWKPSDYLRLAIPPLAFVLWTIVQKSTAWDAVAPDKLSEAYRALIGGAGAVVLGGAAALLGIKAHSSPAGDG